jgi:hypothetical protein
MKAEERVLIAEQLLKTRPQRKRRGKAIPAMPMPLIIISGNQRFAATQQGKQVQVLEVAASFDGE